MAVDTSLADVNESAQSKSKMVIEPRHVKFEFSDIDTPFYYDNNPLVSAIWATLSASFPAGEAEFIRSVRLFEDQVTDPKLKEDVKSFAAQEAHHSLQHRQVNKMLEARGYRTDKLDAFFKDKIAERVDNWSSQRRLARTVVAEHVTAVMAHFALTHPESMKHFPDSFRRLFLWHAIEEIEHKSVAFDVYQECVGDQKLLRKEFRYFSYYEFPLNIFLSSRFLMREMNTKSNWQDKKGLWRYLFGQDGIVSSVRTLYMMFLKPGFHPWDHDDSALVEEWKIKLSPYFLNQ